MWLWHELNKVKVKEDGIVVGEQLLPTEYRHILVKKYYIKKVSTSRWGFVDKIMTNDGRL